MSLAQVHAALTYYYDHEQELNQDIDQRRRLVADIKAKHGDDTLKNKLKQMEALPSLPSNLGGFER